MARRIVSFLCVIAILFCLLAGCSTKLKVEDIAEAPYEKTRDAITQTLSQYSASHSDPLAGIKRAAQSGAFEVKLVTGTGEKVTVTAAQNAQAQSSITTWFNSATNKKWSVAIIGSVLALQPTGQGTWFGLKLEDVRATVQASNLSEALNQSDKAISSRILNKYRIPNSGLLREDDMKTRFAEILLRNTKNAKVTVENGWAESDGEMKDAIIVKFAMSPDMMHALVSDVMEVFQQEQYGHNAYLTNLLRECMRQGGCNFYQAEDVSDTTREKLNRAGEQVIRFYKNADCTTNLMVALDLKSGNVINIACVVQDVVEKETVSFSFNLALSDQYENGTAFDIDMYMDGQEALYQNFNISIQHEIFDDDISYRDTTKLSYQSKNTRWKAEETFHYNKTTGEHEIKTTYNDQDLCLRGTVNSTNGFEMTIDEAIYANLQPVKLNMSIKASNQSATSENIVYTDVVDMDVNETKILLKDINQNMPKLIFGDWEPWEAIDMDVYKEFHPNYDYTGDGVVDAKDRAYFDHIHSIMFG